VGVCKILIMNGFAYKIPVVNKLAPEGLRGLLGFFLIYIQYSGLG
jgi:hypothetical protein